MIQYQAQQDFPQTNLEPSATDMEYLTNNAELHKIFNLSKVIIQDENEILRTEMRKESID